jgi:CheY-like chemotaxis protein
MSKILLVEDNSSDQALIAALLEGAGHDVVKAEHGKEALELLEEHAIQAIVTDLRMPFVNGLRLIRTLRDAGDTIPIVAVSGQNADQLMLAEDYGANAGLMKPLDRKEFLSVIDRVLSDTRGDWTDVWIHPEFGSVGEPSSRGSSRAPLAAGSWTPSTTTITTGVLRGFEL